MLAIACENRWLVYQLDFLQSKIERDVFVKTAPGQDALDKDTGVPVVIKLKCSLYSLSQSPVLWYGTIDSTLLEVGFKPTKSDPCVYTHNHGDDFAILTLYVNDILLTGRDITVLKRLKESLVSRYTMADMWEAGLVLGMTVTRNRK